MTTTNPLLKATRAAFAELTTPEAHAWYRAQAQATAEGAKAIAHRTIVAVRHLLKPKQDLLSGGEVTVPAKDSIKDVAAMDALELCELVDVDLIFPIPTNRTSETIIQTLRGGMSIVSEASGTYEEDVIFEGKLLDKDATELRSNVIATAAVVELPSPSNPFGWAAIEANDVSDVSELEEDATPAVVA